MNNQRPGQKRHIISGLADHSVICSRCNQEIKPNEQGQIIVPCPCRERKLSRDCNIGSISIREILPDEIQQEETGLQANIIMYIRGLNDDIDDLLTRCNIEQHLVEVATYENAADARLWAGRELPFDRQLWHPRAESLVRFIEMQIVVKSGTQ